MFRELALAWLTLATAHGIAAAEGLGEAARREQQRRTERSKAGECEAPKVFTEADLAVPTPTEVGTSLTTAKTDGTAEKPDPEPTAAPTPQPKPPAADEGPTSYGRTERYWRERKRKLEDDASRYQQRVEALEKAG